MSLKSLLVLFLIGINIGVFGQAKQRKADQHYQRLEYYSCAPIYADIAKKILKKKGKADWENVRRAAYSNKQIFQYNRARFYYSKLHETNRMTENDYVEYIDLLRVIGKYDIADLMLQDAIKVYPNNNFVQLLKDKNKDFGYLLKDSSVYSIESLPINSGLGDFCPAFYDKGILYMSKAKNAGFLNTRYGWDNSYFINMLYSPYDLDSTLMNGKVLKDAFFSRAHDGPVSFSPDGKRMVITKNTLGKHNDKEVVVLAIYFSEFVDGVWQEVKPFEHNNPAYNVGHACFSADGKRIYFASEQPGGFGGADLYYSDWNGGNWSMPVNLGNTINTDQDELFPNASANTLFFSSKGHFGIGGLDVFSTPITLTGKVINMGFPINTSYDDFGIIAKADEKGGFFSSNRGDFVDRIYSWTRKDPTIIFEGDLVIEYKSQVGQSFTQDKESVVNEMAEQISYEPIPNYWIAFKDITSNEQDTLYTDSLGHFSYNLIFNHEYEFSTDKKYFQLKNPLAVNTLGITRDTTISGKVLLKPTTILVNLKVEERGTKKPIPYAKVTLTSISTQKDTVVTANDKGIVTLQVDRFAEYIAHASKRGYVDDETKFATNDESNRTIDLLLQLPLIKKGDKFKLENIFYDYNKSTLRPESAASLDKLAAFIMENKLKIELSSHTDARGSDTYNQKLSQARAQSCVDYLLKKGVPKASIVAKGYGEAQLLNRCKNGVTCSEEDHQQNRRTEIKIL